MKIISNFWKILKYIFSEENCPIKYESDDANKDKNLIQDKEPPFEIIPIMDQPLIQDLSSNSTQEESYGAEVRHKKCYKNKICIF